MTRESGTHTSQKRVWLVRIGACCSFPGSPDEDALAVMTSPQAAVAFTGCGKDVRWKLTQAVLSVQVNGSCVIEASNSFVWIHRDQDGANVCLGKKRKINETHKPFCPPENLVLRKEVS